MTSKDIFKTLENLFLARRLFDEETQETIFKKIILPNLINYELPVLANKKQAQEFIKEKLNTTGGNND